MLYFLVVITVPESEVLRLFWPNCEEEEGSTPLIEKYFQ